MKIIFKKIVNAIFFKYILPLWSSEISYMRKLLVSYYFYEQV